MVKFPLRALKGVVENPAFPNGAPSTIIVVKHSWVVVSLYIVPLNPTNSLPPEVVTVSVEPVTQELNDVDVVANVASIIVDELTANISFGVTFVSPQASEGMRRRV
jgi:hypothetical protein